MKSLVFTQYAIVKADSAPLFTEKLNEAIFKLKDNEPTVSFSVSDPLTAYISYIVRETKPETIEEASELEGVRFICEQCPHFSPILKSDGTVDGRVKYGDCDFDGNEFGRSYKKQAACSRLYDLIQEGGVKLCWKE